MRPEYGRLFLDRSAIPVLIDTTTAAARIKSLNSVFSIEFAAITDVSAISSDDCHLGTRR